MVHKVSHRKVVHLGHEPAIKKRIDPLVQGVAPVVDRRLFKWITFAISQGFEPDFALPLEGDIRCGLNEGLS